jgi:hypothetical protein
MKVTMLLCDAAQAVENKLYIIGGGWSVTGPEPSPMALAFKIEVPWDQTNERHTWHLELVDADGELVQLPNAPEGEGLVVIDAEFEVGRPPGVIRGTPIDLSAAINLQPLPLPPGARFTWRLSIDGEHQEDWEVGFTTRPPRQ